jgi:hypothetical protein
MCECGCILNDDKFTFPGPKKSLYVLTLSGGCAECDAGPGVIIERIGPTDPLYKEYRRGEFIEGPLEFEKWSDSHAVAIHTGRRMHEFVEALQKHLIGVDSNELGDKGKIDQAGAEVILEEMYEDAQVKPQIVK